MQIHRISNVIPYAYLKVSPALINKRKRNHKFSFLKNLRKRRVQLKRAKKLK